MVQQVAHKNAFAVHKPGIQKANGAPMNPQVLVANSTKVCNSLLGCCLTRIPTWVWCCIICLFCAHLAKASQGSHTTPEAEVPIPESKCHRFHAPKPPASRHAPLLTPQRLSPCTAMGRHLPSVACSACVRSNQTHAAEASNPTPLTTQPPLAHDSHPMEAAAIAQQLHLLLGQCGVSVCNVRRIL